MKKIILYSFLFLCSLFNAQTSNFTITDEGLTKYVVTEIPGIKKEVAFKRIIDWVNRKFNTPQKAIKGTIDNEYIRIEGMSNSAMRYPAIGGVIYGPIKFEIEITVKDEKYKFEVLSIKDEDPLYPQFSNTPFSEIILNKAAVSDGYNKFRKSNGDFRNRYKYVNDLPEYFNYLNSKLKEYILENNTDDNW